MTCENYTKFKFQPPPKESFNDTQPIHLLPMIYGYFCVTTTEVSSCNRDRVA